MVPETEEDNLCLNNSKINKEKNIINEVKSKQKMYTVYNVLNPIRKDEQSNQKICTEYELALSGTRAQLQIILNFKNMLN